MSKGMKVLVTGGSGRLGQIFAEHSSNTYALRLTYNKHSFEALGCEVVRVDLTDLDSVLRAMQGIEAVVHFGADSALHTPWESTLANNIVGTYNAYEAARQAGVQRLVYASSNHTAGFDIAEGKLVGPDAPIRPDSLYGVSKCFGEALGRYYHDAYGMQVICLRIGSCHGGDTYEGQKRHLQAVIARGGGWPYSVVQQLSIWLSAADMCQLVQRSLETDCPFGIFYGISDNTPAAFDLSETRRQLGYAPQDNVQDLIDVPIAKLS